MAARSTSRSTVNSPTARRSTAISNIHCILSPKTSSRRSSPSAASSTGNLTRFVPPTDRSLTPYELVVGLRYTRARRGSGRNTFISFIALTSMAGIALGVAALIVVLSVMNGFQEELRNRILAVASHIEVRGMPELSDGDAARVAAKARGPAREGGGALCAGAGDAVRGRREPRRDHSRRGSRQRGEGRRHRNAHARRLARRARARQIRHRGGRRDRAGDGVAHGRPGRRHRAARHVDRRRHAAAAEDVSRRRRVRGRHVRV